ERAATTSPLWARAYWAAGSSPLSTSRWMRASRSSRDMGETVAIDAYQARVLPPLEMAKLWPEKGAAHAWTDAVPPRKGPVDLCPGGAPEQRHGRRATPVLHRGGE